MKIVYIIEDLHSKGGTQRVIMQKANYLVEHFGYQVDFIVRKHLKKELAYYLNPQIKIHIIEDHSSIFGRSVVFLSLLRGIYTFSLSYFKLIRQLNPNIVISTNCNPVEIMIPFLSGKSKTFQEFHYSKEIQKFKIECLKGFNRIYSYCIDVIYKNSYRAYDKFIVLTENDAKSWNLKNIEVINNPLPFDTPERSICNNKRVICVGRYEYQKGYEYLIEIWSIISPRYPDWELVIFGAGDNTKYQQLAEKAGIRNSIIFNGVTSDIIKEYKDSSIFVLTSRYEGFVLVLLEAMSIGLPVVSFNCPHGPSEIIKNEEDGFLIPFPNIDSFVDKISYLIENKDERIRIGENASRNIRRFSENVILGQWKRLLDSSNIG